MAQNTILPRLSIWIFLARKKNLLFVKEVIVVSLIKKRLSWYWKKKIKWNRVKKLTTYLIGVEKKILLFLEVQNPNLHYLLSLQCNSISNQKKKKLFCKICLVSDVCLVWLLLKLSFVSNNIRKVNKQILLQFLHLYQNTEKF